MLGFMCVFVALFLIVIGETFAIIAATLGHYAAVRTALTPRHTDAPNTQGLVGAMPTTASLYASPARTAVVAPPAMGHSALAVQVVRWLTADEKCEMRAERRAANVAAMAAEVVATIDRAFEADRTGPYHAGKVMLRYDWQGYAEAVEMLASSWSREEEASMFEYALANAGAPTAWTAPSSRAVEAHRAWSDWTRMGCPN